MNTYKALAAGLAVASLLVASAASAQVATTTATSTAVGVGGPDLAVSITSNGIVLDATQSSQPITVSGLPFSIGAGIGGSCTLMNGSSNLGVIGTTGTAGTLEFPTGNSVTVPAGSMVTLGVTCTGATAGSYPVTLQTSLIPAVVSNTSQSITPRGIGGGDNNDTTAVGTITIGGTGTVTGITGTTGSTSTSGSGSVLGTSTGASLPGSTTSGTGSSATPGVPNTGDGGAAATNFAILAIAGLVAVGGAYALRRSGLTR